MGEGLGQLPHRHAVEEPLATDCCKPAIGAELSFGLDLPCATMRAMVAAAPRIDKRLSRLVRRIAKRGMSSADVHRAVGTYAATLGVVRPSYEQVRQLANDARLEQAARREAAKLLLEVDLGVRPLSDLYPLLEE
jgi:hypothetical protein